MFGWVAPALVVISAIAGLIVVRSIPSVVQIACAFRVPSNVPAPPKLYAVVPVPAF